MEETDRGCGVIRYKETELVGSGPSCVDPWLRYLISGGFNKFDRLGFDVS